MKTRYRRNLKMVTNIAIYIAAILACIFWLPKAIVYFMPFIVGWIISCIANPLVHFLEKRIKIKRKAGTVVVIVLVIAAIIGVAYGVGYFIVKQLSGFIIELPEMWNNFAKDLEHVGNLINRFYIKLPKSTVDILNTVGDALTAAVGSISGKVSDISFSGMGSVVENVANMIIAVIMAMLSAYFFIADREYLNQLYQKHIPESVKSKVAIFNRSILRAVGGYFKAQFFIEIWIYFLIWIGLWIIGVEYAFIIAFGIAVLDFFPVFGSGAVFLPWAILKIISGDYFMAVGMLVLWGLCQLVRQLIQPKIMGDSIGLAPIPTLILLYIGYKVAGVVGMIFAVPIGIILINMNDAGLFDTPKLSIQILVASINNFRRLDDEDLAVLNKHNRESHRSRREIEED